MLIKNNVKAIAFFIKSIKFDVIGIVCYAIIASILDHTDILRNVTIPLPVSAIVGTMLSLLLAFRTAQSYERWWEARKIWGEIVNDSRTLIRQLNQFLPEKAKNDLLTFAEIQILWCFALSEALRKQTFSKKVKDYLEKHNIQAQNIPCYLLNIQANKLAVCSEKYRLDPNIQVQISLNIAKLNDAMGKCERIKNTVFPKSYSLLIHFLIYVFASILPFGLVDVNVLIEIFITIILPLLFIAIEKTAIIMQDPFENQPADVPMTTLCNTIENNINEMFDIKTVSNQNKKSNAYYIN